MTFYTNPHEEFFNFRISGNPDIAWRMWRTGSLYHHLGSSKHWTQPALIQYFANGLNHRLLGVKKAETFNTHFHSNTYEWVEPHALDPDVDIGAVTLDIMGDILGYGVQSCMVVEHRVSKGQGNVISPKEIKNIISDVCQTFDFEYTALLLQHKRVCIERVWTGCTQIVFPMFLFKNTDLTSAIGLIQLTLGEKYRVYHHQHHPL